MRRKLDRQPIPKLVQDDGKYLPRHLPIGTNRRINLVEPNIGRLQGLIEDIETGSAHEDLSLAAPAKSPNY
jgi:hypothetical protein